MGSPVHNGCGQGMDSQPHTNGHGLDADWRELARCPAPVDRRAVWRTLIDKTEHPERYNEAVRGAELIDHTASVVVRRTYPDDGEPFVEWVAHAVRSTRVETRRSGCAWRRAQALVETPGGSLPRLRGGRSRGGGPLRHRRRARRPRAAPVARRRPGPERLVALGAHTHDPSSANAVSRTTLVAQRARTHAPRTSRRGPATRTHRSPPPFRSGGSGGASPPQAS